MSTWVENENCLQTTTWDKPGLVVKSNDKGGRLQWGGRKKGVAAVGHLDHGQAAGERDLAGHVPGGREGGHKGNHSRGISTGLRGLGHSHGKKSKSKWILIVRVYPLTMFNLHCTGWKTYWAHESMDHHHRRKWKWLLVESKQSLTIFEVESESVYSLKAWSLQPSLDLLLSSPSSLPSFTGVPFHPRVNEVAEEATILELKECNQIIHQPLLLSLVVSLLVHQTQRKVKRGAKTTLNNPPRPLKRLISPNLFSSLNSSRTSSSSYTQRLWYIFCVSHYHMHCIYWSILWLDFHHIL